ncbi:MAG: polymerase subunit beta [Actinomycetota bacterium]|nr:polymerase subunit beta [Actinomycetota bacterium]
MKFRCERDDLLEAVQFASRAVSNRATLPVLSGLRIQADESGVVQIAATDLELTMETSFKAGVDEPGKVIVPGRFFGDMSRSLGAGQVQVAAGDGEVEIGSGRGQFRVKSLAADDYPALPIEEEGAGDVTQIDLDASALSIALSQVVRAASGDESRQVLTGVLWEIEAGSVTLAATDSYRLAVRSLSASGGGTETRKVVLPARTLGEIGRAIQGRSQTITVRVQSNFASFKITSSGEEGSGAGDSIVGSRFIEGEFPNYKQLIPQGYSNALTVDKDKLLEVTKRVGLLAQNNLPVKLRLGNELEVSAHTPDIGEGQEILDATYEGEELVIAFNPQFLYDGASAMQGDNVVLEVADGLKPAILHDAADQEFTYLLMPVRLS